MNIPSRLSLFPSSQLMQDSVHQGYYSNVGSCRQIRGKRAINLKSLPTSKNLLRKSIGKKQHQDNVLSQVTNFLLACLVFFKKKIQIMATILSIDCWLLTMLTTIHQSRWLNQWNQNQSCKYREEQTWCWIEVLIWQVLNPHPVAHLLVI